MTGLLLQLWRSTFLPRRGRRVLSLSCDRAATFCYPDKRQLTGLGCQKAPSPAERCLAHGVRAGGGRRLPAGAMLCRLCPVRGQSLALRGRAGSDCESGFGPC